MNLLIAFLVFIWVWGIYNYFWKKENCDNCENTDDEEYEKENKKIPLKSFFHEDIYNDTIFSEPRVFPVIETLDEILDKTLPDEIRSIHLLTNHNTNGYAFIDNPNPFQRSDLIKTINDIRHINKSKIEYVTTIQFKNDGTKRLPILFIMNNRCFVISISLFLSEIVTREGPMIKDKYGNLEQQVYDFYANRSTKTINLIKSLYKDILKG